MKDAEDEAFEAIEKAQGWRKRQIAEKKGEHMNIEVMKAMANYIDVLGGDSKKYRQAIAEAEKQEPVCPYCHDSHTLGDVYYDQNCVGCVRRMTATPQPQREWVGLTDEERNHARSTVTYSQMAMTAGEWAEAVQIETERRLKEKNT
jgi:hypothetical protein